MVGVASLVAGRPAAVVVAENLAYNALDEDRLSETDSQRGTPHPNPFPVSVLPIIQQMPNSSCWGVLLFGLQNRSLSPVAFLEALVKVKE